MKLTKKDLMVYFIEHYKFTNLTKKDLNKIVSDVLDNLIIVAIEHIKEDIEELNKN